MARRKEITLREFFWRVGVLCIFALVIVIAIESGLLFKGSMGAAKQLVPITDPNKLVKMKEPNSGPKVIVLKTGERIECQNVMDIGTGYWSYFRKDGAVSSVKKYEVKEIEGVEPKM